jgi:hypothetical protein
VVSTTNAQQRIKHSQVDRCYIVLSDISNNARINPLFGWTAPVFTEVVNIRCPHHRDQKRRTKSKVNVQDKSWTPLARRGVGDFSPTYLLLLNYILQRLGGK